MAAGVMFLGVIIFLLRRRRSKKDSMAAAHKQEVTTALGNSAVTGGDDPPGIDVDAGVVEARREELGGHEMERRWEMGTRGNRWEAG